MQDGSLSAKKAKPCPAVKDVKAALTAAVVAMNAAGIK